MGIAVQEAGLGVYHSEPVQLAVVHVLVRAVIDDLGEAAATSDLSDLRGCRRHREVVR